MGQISTLFVHKVVGVAAPADGGDEAMRRALFESVGIDPDAPVDPKRMIEDSGYYALCERGLAFHSLVDECRRQLAERLLLQTRYSLSEIAFLTGFSEQSAFTRAFKRWTGITPRAFRRETESGPTGKVA